MASRSFRDRFWSPPVARAVTAPGSILLAGAAAAVAVVATAPLALPVSIVAGVVAGAGAYGARVLAAVPGAREGRPRVDPFQLQEPWRRFVSDAQAAHGRLREIVRSSAPGPLRETLESISARLDEGVDEIWRICQQGHALVAARQRIDVDSPRRELADIERQPSETWAAGTRLGQTADALRAQIASAERMDAVIEDAIGRVRLLDARLDEAVARAAELASGTGGTSLAASVSGDVEGIVTEMEALRLALDELDHRSVPGPAATWPPSGTPGSSGLPGTPGPPGP